MKQSRGKRRRNIFTVSQSEVLLVDVLWAKRQMADDKDNRKCLLFDLKRCRLYCKLKDCLAADVN